MPAYFDHNATTPVDPRVRDAMLPWLGERHGNPSSIHRWGRAAREAVEAARGEVAALLGARPAEVVFTASGTEANTTVLTSVARRAGFRGHLVVSALEHPSVRAGVALLEAAGMTVTRVAPGAGGVVDPAAVAAALTPETKLVALMRANNEIGTLQPVAEVAALCRERGVPVLCDAVQAVGKVAVDVGELGADWVVLGGHKFHGPPGVAALWVDPRAELEPLLVGGGQRAGAAEADGAGVVLGARPPPPLLAAADEERVERRVGAHPERRHAGRAVELVAAQRQPVRPQRRHVDRHLAHRLHRVAEHRHAALAAEGGDLGDRLQGADLVVGEHQRDELRVIGERRRHRRRVDHAAGAGRHPRHRHPRRLGERHAGAHRRVLEGGDDEMAAEAGAAGDGGEHRVVGLGAGGGEDDLPRPRAEERRHLAARRLHRLARRPPPAVDRRRVAVQLAEPRQHRLAHPRVEGSGGVVVEVASHLGEPPMRTDQSTAAAALALLRRHRARTRERRGIARPGTDVECLTGACRRQ